jgi:hypothetical protein
MDWKRVPAAEKPSDSAAVVRLLRGIKYHFLPGHITPLLDGPWYGSFKGSVDLYDSKRLVELFRNLNGYSLKKLKENRDDPDWSTWRRLEDTVQSIRLTYRDVERASSHRGDSHLYRNGVLDSALGMPNANRILGLLHDVGEDMAELDLRFVAVADGKKVGKISRFDSVLDFVEDRHGLRVAEAVRVMTRPPEQESDKKSGNLLADLLALKLRYAQYLGPIRDDLLTSGAKAVDRIVNDLEPARSEERQMEMSNKNIVKSSILVPDWQKTAWLVSEIMLTEIERQEQSSLFEGATAKLRKVSPEELEKFRRGFVWIDAERAFTRQVLEASPLSGSPTIIAYSGGERLEMEFPFLKLVHAEDIVRKVMGDRAKDVRKEDSLLPYHLRYAAIVSFEADESELRSHLPAIVSGYNVFLKDEEKIRWPGDKIRPQEKRKFDRNAWADAVERRGNLAEPRATQEILFQGNEAVQELPEQPALSPGLPRRPRVPKERTPSPFGSIPPLAGE